MLAYFPNFAPQTLSSNPFANLWEPVFSVYQRAFEHTNQELWTSSMRIIQEHAARAWIEASQSCMAALSENAAAIQQRAFARLIDAQQEATAIAAREVTEAVVGR
ncbi:hypothetical protein ASC94_04350 [Massilia sp. Root418]|jgi:hypothetical protein|uniref:hypothetical protein n=1 Tax=Massilia sp. Root418 TaxID=1736532 RepID=UPI0006F91A36|nr:hypothetical protein [Massilia sp. Root418]KQX01828.1 hypothetical protein ASC94_04350 [Massilia sp. Root418]